MTWRRGVNQFHPELRHLARILPRTLVTPVSVKVFRALPAPRASEHAHGVRVVTLPSGVEVRIHLPQSEGMDALPALLWIHGGGFVLGRAAMDDRLCRRLARDTGATVAAVDYRLAPEHPYPAALDDCHEALRWLAADPSIDPERVAVAGASAGGGLAAALAHRVRDHHEMILRAQVLVYPMLDDRTGRQPDPEHRQRRLWNATSNRLGWTAYLGTADPNVAVPARSEDLGGVAPAWIGVGTADLLYDEAVTYAKRLREAGVTVDFEVVEGAFHGFDAVAPRTAVAQSFYKGQVSSLQRAFEER
jgi:acetyl esterase/lipase